MDLEAWLRELNLLEYADTLARHKVDLGTLALLSEGDLERIGVPLGPRKKLLSYFRTTGSSDRQWPPSSSISRPEFAVLQKLRARSQESAASRRGSGEPSEPERRQVTVLFCDLVGSTRLSRELDPEDLCDVLRTYQSSCTAVVERHGGSVSRIVGDALLVLFGYPKAHEDDAERSVRAGLGVIEAVSTLDLSAFAPATKLALRVGIATGLVVVGDLIGKRVTEQESVVGVTPNLAARLQAMAAPNSVVVAESTWKLVEGLFEHEDLGCLQLEGFAEPTRAFRVKRARPVESRFEAKREARGLTPLVGRKGEVGLLRDRWRSACAGRGSVLRISGDPGIGKSRLVRILRDYTKGEPHAQLVCYCSEYHQNTALFPVISEIERSAGFAVGDPPLRKLEKLASHLVTSAQNQDETYAVYRSLLSLGDTDQLNSAGMTPEIRKVRTLRALEDRVGELARRGPVLLIFEDIHWSDPTTLELLERLAGRVANSRVLMVITHRPEFRPRSPLLQGATMVVLNRMVRREAVALILELTSRKALPGEVLERILAETDGIPLFIEELTRSVLEAGVLSDDGDRYVLGEVLPQFAVPSTLHDSLMARLDRLKSAKRVAQISAVIGRQFSVELLRQVASLDIESIEEDIEHLTNAQLVYWESDDNEGTYAFKHALVKDAAYSSLLRRQRQDLHARIARTLEARFPDVRETQPELLARHFTAANLAEPAWPYWLRAGRQAAGRSANPEAADHLARGLAVLSELPETTERDQVELEFQTTLGPALIAARGYVAADVERAYERARQLCRRSGDTYQLVRVLRGLWAFYIVRADLGTALGVAHQIHEIAQSANNHDYALEAQRASGQAHFYLGHFAEAETHLQQALELYRTGRHEQHAVQYGNDPKAVTLSYQGWVAWCLGYPNRARELSRKAVACARALGHPFTIAQVMVGDVYVHALRRDLAATRRQSARVVAYAREQGFPYWKTIGEIFNAWAQALEGDEPDAIAGMRRSLERYKATGSCAAYPWFLGLMAEVQSAQGHFDDALAAITDALVMVEATREGYAASELHRLQGELLLRLRRWEEAEACFERALQLARAQRARSWELRSAVSLARLWHSQGHHAVARATLGGVIQEFPEATETTDLDQATRLWVAMDDEESLRRRAIQH